MPTEAQPTPGLPFRPSARLETEDAPLRPGGLATLAGAVLLTAGASAGIALAVAPHGFLQSIDDAWAASTAGEHGGLRNLVAVMIEGGFGGPAGVIAWVALAGWLAAVKRPWSALCAVSACIASNILLLPAKAILDRPRPDEPLTLVSGASFPSGHACSAAALAVLVGVLVLRRRGRRLWWVAGGSATALDMWSATWLHANWLSDVVAGACLGAGAALLLWRAFAGLLLREVGTEG
ncbi:phosphatase PAP2 family protein [Streptacidiphilus rugosus]|uniref:phosphatase PAP2 family protein n=1 Tax=Streptacidiphilus rugosus TaxID=405783 RepID=UPI00068BED95|nr:phosphatase PAP2 family protein [Streptacidiphilus rugosus]